MDIVEAVVRVLSADGSITSAATGGIWEAVARRTSKPPYVIVTHVSGNSEYSLSREVEINSGTIDVKVITQGESFATAESIRDLFDAALHAVNGRGAYEIRLSLVGSEMCIRDRDGDTRYNHLGWTYRYMYSGALG